MRSASDLAAAIERSRAKFEAELHEKHVAAMRQQNEEGIQRAAAAALRDPIAGDEAVTDAQGVAEALAEGGEYQTLKNGFLTYCPVHGESPARGSSPSLMVFDRPRGGVRTSCHVGCAPEEVQTELLRFPKLEIRRKPICPVPLSAEEPKFPPSVGTAQFCQAWRYQDEDGRTEYWRARYNKPTSNSKGKVDKVILPYSYYEGYGWDFGAPETKSLYGRQKLKHRLLSTVLLVEGEKAADAAEMQVASMVAMSWDGGAPGVETVDISPLTGRNVVILPDADAVKAGKQIGMLAAMKMAGRLSALPGTTISIVPVDRFSFPCDGWDIADAAEGDGVDIDALLAAAIPYDAAQAMEQATGWRPAEQKRGKEKENVLAKVIEQALEAGDQHFLSPDGTPHVTFRDEHQGGHHWETHAIKSDAYRSKLNERYFLTTQRALNKEAENAAINMFKVKAKQGEVVPVHVRIAEHQGKRYIDIGGRDWSAYELDDAGYRIVSVPPVKFVRSGSRGELPRAERGGSRALYEKHFNLNDENLTLLLGTLVSFQHPTGPYPLMLVRAPTGRGKSMLPDKVTALVDPAPEPAGARMSMPRKERELHITASRCRIVVLDNVGKISAEQSNMLCRLSTGGGSTARELYSDASEVIIAVKRPCIITCIDYPTTAPDFLNRCIELNPEPIEYLPEEIVREEFDADKGRMLGYLFDAVVTAIRRDKETRAAFRAGDLRSDRLSDAAKIIEAAAPALGLQPGEFCALLSKQQDRVQRDALEEHPVVRVLARYFAAGHEELKGTAGEIFQALEGSILMHERREWPSAPSRLGRVLIELRPRMQGFGLHMEVRQDKARNSNVYTIRGIDMKPLPF